jgi:hypothetical protein
MKSTLQQLGLLSLIVWLSTASLSAQDGNEPVAADTTAQSLRVHRTTVWAACVPGAGQIRNRKYWKAPIVWGAVGFLGDALVYDIREFNNSKTWLRYETDDDPMTLNPSGLSAAVLEERAVFYRRQRDLAVLGLFGVHLLSILDANVDAHLMDFDVSENLKASLFYNPLSGTAGIALNW